MSPLAKKHCIPCEGDLPPLSKEQAETFLEETPKWILADDAKSISRTFKFTDFEEAMLFVNAVAELAETEGHHPNIMIVWSKVTLTLTTHAIKGLSENDFILAYQIDRIEGEVFQKEE